LSIELLDDCRMLLPCWHDLKNIWPWQLHHSVTGPFSRALKYCQTITKKNVLSWVLQGALSRELPSVFLHPFLHEHVSRLWFAWKDSEKETEKVLCTMQESE
jgi:hypothetical protein